jgi:EAL and modified HD-GYP domain-containing signal transduction protein
VLRRLFGRRPPPPPPPPPSAAAPPPAAAPAPAAAPTAPAPEAAVVAAAADAIIATDPAGQITLANRAALAITGYGERELIGNPLHGLLHPGCEDERCPVNATRRDGTPRTFVTETVRKRDGSQFAAEVALSAMREGGLVAVVRDVSERRREVDGLRATAEGYRDLVEGVEDWIWTADRSGLITFSNRGGEAVVGYRPALLIGRTLLDVTCPDDRDEQARRLDAAAAAKEGWTATVRRRHADGTDRALDSRASPIIDADGALAGWRGVERPAAPAPVEASREVAPPEAAPPAPVPSEAARLEVAPSEVPTAEEARAEEARAEEARAEEPPTAEVPAAEAPAEAAPAEEAPAEEAPAEAAAAEEDAPVAPPLTAPAVRRPVVSTRREVAIVRQPIADAEGGVVGYELLVGGEALGPRPLGEAGATAAMLLDVFGDVGLDRLAGRHPAWVTITPGFLLEVGTPPVRPDRVVLQLAASPVPADALAALQRLRWSGYTVALSGYDGRAELGELLEVCAIVKIGIADRSDAELRTAIAEPAKRGLQLAATRVETPEEVERCRALGFSLFQGSFFAKPNLVRQRRVGTGGAPALRTLAGVSAPEASFEDLEQAISADVGLSLKLLRYVNSAFFSLPRTVGSVHEALTLLGMATVRRWATVMALVDATSDASEELVELALQRARMCEVLGGGSPEGEQGDALFTVGLFSVADALLDRPMEEVLETLPFSDDIRDALLRHEGTKGQLLERVMSYERGEFPDDPGGALSLPAAYADSLPWASEARQATTPDA